MERIVGWDDPILKAPSPTSFPTYFARHVYIPNSIRLAAQRFRGENTDFAFIYGSSLYKEDASSGMIDMGIFVENIGRFHQENMKAFGGDYGDPHSVWFHTWFNKNRPNFYHTKLSIDGEIKPAKYFSIQFDQAIDRLNSWDIYLSGRLHKPMIAPLVEPADQETKNQLNYAVNQSRINGAVLALALIDEEFSFRKFAEVYASISYLGDRRGKYEKDNKHLIILEECWDEFGNMLPPILEALTDVGMIESTGNDNFARGISLSHESVEKFLEKSNRRAKVLNISNAVTVGIQKSLKYVMSKEERARASRARVPEIA